MKKLAEYKILANGSALVAPADLAAQESAFWKIEPGVMRPYASDVPASLTQKSQWNMSRLGTLLDELIPKYSSAPGVHTPYTYFGAWGTFFAFHVEDMNLSSLNYMHFGKPKTWYIVPPDQKKKMDAIITHLTGDNDCHAPQNHKAFMIAPEVLISQGIRLSKVRVEYTHIIKRVVYYNASQNDSRT